MYDVAVRKCSCAYSDGVCVCACVRACACVRVCERGNGRSVHSEAL